MNKIYTLIEHLSMKLSKKMIFTLVCFALTFISTINADAQTGYIYIHKKALDESSSVDFPFNVSGGTTSVPNFSLNDKPENVTLKDIGASQNGRLWAVSTTGALYYRDLGSATWVLTAITNVGRVDGGPLNTCYYISGSNVYSYDGVTSTALSAGNASYGNSNAVDIGSSWNNQPYIINNNNELWYYSGTGTSWTKVTVSGGFIYNRLDGDPATGNAIISFVGGGGNIYTVTTTGTLTNLGKPAAATSNLIDITVDGNGNIYASYKETTNYFVYKWVSGTTWTVGEDASRSATNITAGIGGQLWSIYLNSANNPAEANIYSRAANGTNITYIDDERVRTTNVGNSQMIAVAPGTYTITELVPAGWDLYDITIYDPTSNSTSSITGNTATLTVEDGETVHAIFSNGVVNPFAMTTSCTANYVENFGTGSTGTYGSPFLGQTSYHYLNTAAGSFEGSYKIISQSDDMFAGATHIYDHTSAAGTGRMMVVDAGVAKDEFFHRRFTGLVPGATYNFSAWIANIGVAGGISPNVFFGVLNTTDLSVISSTNSGDVNIPGVWQQTNLSFVATTTTIDLVLRNNAIGGAGNDLAIDDIVFQMLPVTKPITTVVNAGCGETTGSITITSPLGSNYEYSLDNFTDPLKTQSSPVFGPLAPGIYTVYARFIGTTGCVASKIDTVGVSICGNIWNDTNGDAVNAGENPVASGVWVNLVDPVTNAVLQSVQVDASGNYSITKLLVNTDYKIILSNSDQTGNTSLTTATLPAGYVSTGTNISGVASTTNKTGVITVNSGTTGLINQNFGIEQAPLADNISQPIPYPAGGIIPAGTLTSDVTGNDPEQGSLNGANAPIIIDAIPGNATMYYNSILVNAGDTIRNFDPALISYTGVAAGSTSVVFDYSFLDDANIKSITPATYTVFWGNPLPVTFIGFDVYKNAGTSVLKWITASEQNNKGFEIQRSNDGLTWLAIGFVNTKSVSGNSSEKLSYSFNDNNPLAGTNYYRLQQIDFDGKYQYSDVRSLNFDNKKEIRIYPNPTQKELFIQGLTGSNTISVVNTTGQVLMQVVTKNNAQQTIDVSRFTKGIYFITVKGENGSASKFKIVKE